MPIVIKTPETPEVLIYNNIYVIGIKMVQDENNDSSSPSKYKVRIRYKLYALDSSGTRHFESKSSVVIVLDYLQDAIGKNNLGDSTMLDAFISVERAISLIITDKGSIGETEVVA